VRLDIEHSVDQPPLSEEQAKQLRARCPLTSEEKTLDLEIAQALLGDPKLYAEALGRTSGNLAGRGAEPLAANTAY
jgi:hypothetical protein